MLNFKFKIMKVKELIEELKCFDEDSEVCIFSKSGDYWRTELANETNSVENVDVAYSEYHNTNKIVDDDRIDSYDEEDLKQVVLIS